MIVFLASSIEALDELHEVASWIEEAGHNPLPWDSHTLFLPGENTFEKLIEISKQVDAAIFIFSEDDSVWYRTDTFSQPRDNVLIEYGLFAGALGQKRAAICRRGKPKTATDLRGIVVIDITDGKKQGARIRLGLWLKNLLTKKEEDPAVTALVMQREHLKLEIEIVRNQLSFEQQAKRDLQEIMTSRGLIDFSKYDFSRDGHWKLLFKSEYFWNVVTYLEETFQTPSAWYNELKRSSMTKLISKIQWTHMKDNDRTAFYIAKSFRYFRRMEDFQFYLEYLNNTSPVIKSRIDAIGTKTVIDIQKEQLTKKSDSN